MLNIYSEDDSFTGEYFIRLCQHLDKLLFKYDKDISIYSTMDINAIPNDDSYKIISLTSDEMGTVTPNMIYAKNIKNLLLVVRVPSYPKNLDYKLVYPVPYPYKTNGLNNVNLKKYGNVKMTDRPIDVFFFGQILTYRETLIQKLMELKKFYNIDLHLYNNFNRGMETEKYYELMSNSKIVVCPRGCHDETFRLSEALGCGCNIITTPKPNYYYYSNIKLNIINNWNELNSDYIKSILNDDLEKNRIESLNNFDKYYSEQAVANYIFNIIKTKLPK